MINEALLAEIFNTLPHAVLTNLSSATHGGDVYEVYIWTLLLKAARAEGAEITFWNIPDQRARSDFFFRSSPGNMFSTVHPYTYALISFPNAPELEAHIGIYVVGKSRVKHECDVAVLFEEEASTCRAENVHPRNSQVILAVECKFYVGSIMGIGLARSFLGLTTDIMQANRFFVGVTESEPVEALFTRHRKNYETGVSPLDARRRFVRLQGAFERVFRDYRRRYGV